MPFFDCRLDAAGKLALALDDYRGRKPIVLALARGAVGMGAAIADELGGELDVALVRKLRAPFCPQLSVGAVDDSGWTYVARHAPGAGVDSLYLATEKAAQLRVLRLQRTLYRGSRNPLDLKGRTVIIVDDGMATGTTMITALLAARSKRVAHLVCAVPVAPSDTLFELAPCADQFFCLDAREHFDTVSTFYRSFPRVSDEEASAFFTRRAAAQV